MNTISQSVLSTNYVQTPITITYPSGYDPTSDPVTFAFTALSYPTIEPAVWYTGSWLTFPGPVYWAQCLVGPAAGVSGTVLSIGSYAIWYKITDSPEVPVATAGTLTITP